MFRVFVFFPGQLAIWEAPAFQISYYATISSSVYENLVEAL